MQQNILVYFRNDLRLHDHEALFNAAACGAGVIGFYQFNSELFKKNDLGFRRTDVIRAQFLIESVYELRTELRKCGSDLIISIGDSLALIPDLCSKLNISDVYVNEEAGHDEKREELLLRHKLNTLNIRLSIFRGHTICNPEALPFAINKTPDLFTDFRKAVENAEAFSQPLPAIGAINGIKHEIPQGEISLGILGFSSDELENKQFIFKGGENEGLKRLNYYLWETGLVANYKETRNGLLGTDFSSRLSPWLAAGCLSPRMVTTKLKKFETERVKNDSTYWLFFELLWRDFFHFSMLKYGKSYHSAGGIKGLKIEWNTNRQLFEKWMKGETGCPFIDANMRELRHTGYMSNRGRQNVASYLCKNLGINWLWGAAWFESQLVDYDVCSNYGNWAYIAGVGNDTRKFRYFNIEKQAEMYDPDGKYQQYWLNIDGYDRLGLSPIVDLEQSIKSAEKRYSAGS